MNLVFPPKVLEYLNGLQARPGKGEPNLQTVIETRAGAAFQALIPTVRKHFLDAKYMPKFLLDIGSGLALLDIPISRALNILQVYLMDGDGSGERIQHKYSAEQKAWNSVDLGLEMVKANTENVVVTPFAPNPDFFLPVDLLVSFRSWGHHYPVSVYLKLAQKCMTEHGLIVLDVRAGTTGLQELEAGGFELVDRIPDHSNKCQRLALKRKQ